MPATLGFTAHGIEIAADLVAEAERLLADHRLRATSAGSDPSGCRAPPAAQGDAADEGNAAE